MFKNRIWARVLAAVASIGLLIAGGVSIYRAGWSRGYVASSPVVEGDEAEMSAPLVLGGASWSWCANQ
ncbi:MAG: hypothetical protein U9Q70_09735 [Chloroflexota bacterium]|nr:hypothetical protein [Chloroflexota bacterium]